MITVYESHPFSGNEEKNRRHARKLATQICKMVWENNSQIAILNPCDCIRYAENAHLSYGQCIDICLALLDKCDVMFLMKGWDNSRGCVLETAYALEKGILVTEVNEPLKETLKNGKLKILNNKKEFVDKINTLIDTLNLKDVDLINKDFLELKTAYMQTKKKKKKKNKK